MCVDSLFLFTALRRGLLALGGFVFRLLIEGLP